MKPGMKMLMIANRGGNRSGEIQSERQGARNTETNRNYGGTDNPYNEMRYGYERPDAEMRRGNRDGGNRSEMNYGRSGGSNQSEYEMRDRSERMNYGEMEGQFRSAGRSEYRDDRGMNASDNYDTKNRRGGYDAQNRYEMESRRYRRDERGRFAPKSEYGGMGMESDYGMESRYPIWPSVPPIYEAQKRDEYRPMNRIGFNTGEEMNPDYRSYTGYPQIHEMENRSSTKMMGHAMGGGSKKLTKEMADEWMEGLQNEDGSTGPHWTFEQVKQVMAQKGVRADPLEFFVTLNAMYADYCKVFKKYGVGDKLDLYVDMAKAFIEDKDAEEGKVANYFHNIVKH